MIGGGICGETRRERESSCGGWTVFDKSVDPQVDIGIFVEKCANREIRKLVGEFSFEIFS